MRVALEKPVSHEARVGRSQVNFPRKEVEVAFESGSVKLSEIVGLLASLGYEPKLRLSDLDGRALPADPRRLWMQLGVAGFAFGNTMLFSIASYLAWTARRVLDSRS